VGDGFREGVAVKKEYPGETHGKKAKNTGGKGGFHLIQCMYEKSLNTTPVGTVGPWDR